MKDGHETRKKGGWEGQAEERASASLGSRSKTAQAGGSRAMIYPIYFLLHYRPAR